MDMATLGIVADSTDLVTLDKVLDTTAQKAAFTEQAAQRLSKAMGISAGQARLLNDALRQQTAIQTAALTQFQAVDPLMERLAEGTNSWTVGMQKLATTTPRIVESVGHAEVGFGGLERVLSGVAAESLGANERIVGLGAHLLGFATGGEFVAVALAGIAALGAAMEGLGEETHNTQKAYDDYMASLRKSTPLSVVGGQLDDEKDKLLQLATSLNRSGQAALAVGSNGVFVEHQSEAVTISIEAQTAALQKQVGVVAGLQLEQDAFIATQHAITVAAQAYNNALVAVNRELAAEQSATTFAQSLQARIDVLQAPLAGPAITALHEFESQYETASEHLTEIDKQRGLAVIAGLRHEVQVIVDAQANIHFENALKGLEDAASHVTIPVHVAFIVDPDPLKRIEGQFAAGLIAPIPDPDKPLHDAQAMTGAIRNAVAAGLDLSDAFGLVDQSTQGILSGLLAAGLAANELSKATSTLDKIAGITGLISGVVGFISSTGAFGESPEDKALIALEQQQVDELRQINRNFNSLSITSSGRELVTDQAGLAALMGAGSGGLGIKNDEGMLTDRLDFGKVHEVLAGTGATLGNLEAIAQQLGITFKTDTLDDFTASVNSLNLAMKKSDFATFSHDFESQHSATLDRFTLFKITDPSAQLAVFSKLLKDQGSTLLTGALATGDASTTSGREAIEQRLKDLFTKLETPGGITDLSALGGLSVSQFEKEILELNGVLSQADDAISAVVDGLKDFHKSLELDQSLTTLSPVQQLAVARQQYLDDLAKAKAGDQAAASALPDLARQFLSLDKAVNASGPQFASDFANVLADSDALANMFAGQVDVATQQLAVQNLVQSNTAQTVEHLKTSIDVTAAGFQQLLARVDALTEATAAGLGNMSRKLEGSRIGPSIGRRN